jgi:hypothetical protein
MLSRRRAALELRNIPLQVADKSTENSIFARQQPPKATADSAESGSGRKRAEARSTVD